MKLRAPFPYFGSKLTVAPLVEDLMGPVNNLVIPFGGSLGELLGRQTPAKIETVGDADGFIVNAWRAMQRHPERLAELCDRPVHEATMHAAHDLLLARAGDLEALVMSHPDACDVELAAWWIWGASCWLGQGWCREAGAMRKRPKLAGQGDRPQTGRGVTRQLPMLSGSDGSGVGYGQGIHAGQRAALLAWFKALSERLRFVRVAMGDWQRVCTPAVTTSHGTTGVSLDPPYAGNLRARGLYRKDSGTIAEQVRGWAMEHDRDPLLRIVLYGKHDEHDATLERGWSRLQWRDDGETLWASPSCAQPRQAAFTW